MEISISLLDAGSKIYAHPLQSVVYPPSKLAQAVMLLPCIQEVPALNLGHNTDYHEAFVITQHLEEMPE
jgi:hypothetical protein